MGHTKFQKWLITNEPEDKMLYKKAWWDSYIFIRDIVIPIFYYDSNKYDWQNISDYNNVEDKNLSIVGKHYSKSIKHPVIRIYYKNCEVVFRYNFYNYEIAIDAKEDILLPDYKTFNKNDNSFFQEGFPAEYKVKDNYATNQKRFMVCCWNKYDFYTFVKILKTVLDEN